MEILPDELEEQVKFYQANAFSFNTKRSYSVHRRSYISFCNRLGVAPVPATSKLICLYAAFLAKRLKYSSVKQYLNIVRILHSEWGLPNPCEGNYFLKCTLRGIRRHLGDAVCRKAPITPSILRRILSALDVSEPKGASVWAACLVMFFGLLRKSNVLPSSCNFDPTRHLRRRDLRFTKQGLRISLRWSKTIQFGERCFTIPYPWRSGHPLCPTQGAYNAVRLTRRAPLDGPAFVVDDSPDPTPLSPELFMREVRRALREPGLDTTTYSGHSFRRGGAGWAFANQVSIELVRLLGDWRSNAYTAYISPTEEGLSSATNTMLNNIPV